MDIKRLANAGGPCGQIEAVVTEQRQHQSLHAEADTCRLRDVAIARLARHCAVDHLRRRSKIAHAPLELAAETLDDTPPTHDLIEHQEMRVRLDACIDLLAPGDGTLIRTAFFQGASYSELARRTARPLGTVKSRIRRALTKLAECLA